MSSHDMYYGGYFDYDYNEEDYEEDFDQIPEERRNIYNPHQPPVEDLLSEAQRINPDFSASSLEYLLSIPQRINPENNNEEEESNKLSLYEFKQKNLNKLKEDLLYYYSSPDTLLNFKSSIEEEKIYDFYKNIDCENFMADQKERIKIILSQSQSNIDSQMKMTKLSSYKTNFCAKASLIDGSEESLINATLIGIKMDECSFLCSEKEIDENKIISSLYELKDTFEKKPINMKYLGLILFNSIEKNLIFILNLIENIFDEKNNTKNLTTLILICVEILKSFHSTKLYFFIIKLLNKHQELKSSIKIESNEEIQFIPNNCFDYAKIYQYSTISLIKDLRKSLSETCFINKNDNQIKLDYDDYITLNYEDLLLFFFHCQNDEKIIFIIK